MAHPWMTLAVRAAIHPARLVLTSEGERYGSLRGVGSLRSLASSIRRTASRTLSSRGERSPGPSTAFPSVAADANQPEPEAEVMEEVLCPSPASTVGVPKRIRDHDSSHHRPSTIRLVSPSESLLEMAAVEMTNSPLPLTGPNSVAHIKERRSMKPLRDVNTTNPPASMKNRRSLPTLLSPASTSTGIYPPLPSVDPTAPPEVQAAMATPSPEPEMPGSFPASPADNKSPTSPSFMFGTTQAVSNDQFSDAGAKLLAELNAKMGGSSIFSTELLKGKDAEITKLMSSRDLAAAAAAPANGKRGFGLAPDPEMVHDRYAAAHAREFQRMKSLQSVGERKVSSSSQRSQIKRSASGNLLDSSSDKAAAKRKLDTATAAEPTAVEEAASTNDRGTKRSKVAPAPKPSIIDALRRQRASSKSPVKPVKPPVRTLKGTMGSRFGFLRGHKKTPSGGSIAPGDIPSPSKSPASIASEGSYVLPSTKVPEDKVAPPSRLKKMSTKSTMLRAAKQSAPPTAGPSTTSATSSAASSLSKSTVQSSAQSFAKSSVPRRGAIPEFGGHKPTFQPLKDNSQDHGSASSRASVASRVSGASAPPATSIRYKASPSSSSLMSRSSANHDLAQMASGENLRQSAQQMRKASVDTLRQVSGEQRRGFPSARQPSMSNMRSPSTSNLRSPSMNNLRSPSMSNLRSPSMSNIPRSASRSSTLLAPTASSLARMQATVKPPARRPLPVPPKGASAPPPSSAMSPNAILPNLTVAQPFGEAASRANYLFESNFHISPADGTKLPLPSSKSKVDVNSPLKSPTKRPLPATPKSPIRAQRSANRARASGLNAIKAAGHTNNADVARRRTEMRGKQERLTQEKELRMMLG